MAEISSRHCPIAAPPSSLNRLAPRQPALMLFSISLRLEFTIRQLIVRHARRRRMPAPNRRYRRGRPGHALARAAIARRSGGYLQRERNPLFQPPQRAPRIIGPLLLDRRRHIRVLHQVIGNVMPDRRCRNHRLHLVIQGHLHRDVARHHLIEIGIAFTRAGFRGFKMGQHRLLLLIRHGLRILHPQRLHRFACHLLRVPAGRGIHEIFVDRVVLDVGLANGGWRRWLLLVLLLLLPILLLLLVRLLLLLPHGREFRFQPLRFPLRQLLLTRQFIDARFGSGLLLRRRRRLPLRRRGGGGLRWLFRCLLWCGGCRRRRRRFVGAVGFGQGRRLVFARFQRRPDLGFGIRR